MRLFKHKIHQGWLACEVRPGWFNGFIDKWKKQIFSALDIDLSDWEETTLKETLI